MKLADIKGNVTATVRHSCFHGQRLLIAQPVNEDGSENGSPQIVLDPFGAAVGQRVMISSDGKEAREYVGCMKSPARWLIMGIVDPEGVLNL